MIPILYSLPLKKIFWDPDPVFFWVSIYGIRANSVGAITWGNSLIFTELPCYHDKCYINALLRDKCYTKRLFSDKFYIKGLFRENGVVPVFCEFLKYHKFTLIYPWRQNKTTTLTPFFENHRVSNKDQVLDKLSDFLLESD